MPVGLGLVEHEVGVLEQLFGIFAVLGIDRDADAGAAVDLPALDVEGLGEGLDDPLGRGGGAVHGGEVVQDDGELVTAEAGYDLAAVARHRIALPHVDLKALGAGLQQLVADAVAQGIVHALEVVEIEEQNREHSSRAVGLRHRMLQAFGKRLAVGQAGEAVVERQIADAILCPLAFGDVLDRDAYPRPGVDVPFRYLHPLPHDEVRAVERLVGDLGDDPGLALGEGRQHLVRALGNRFGEALVQALDAALLVGEAVDLESGAVDVDDAKRRQRPAVLLEIILDGAAEVAEA